MSRQTIAKHWKTLETLFNQRTQQFSEESRKFGKFTAATAAEKMAVIAHSRGYKWVDKPFHGFGGYWVNSNGDTIELLPA